MAYVSTSSPAHKYQERLKAEMEGKPSTASLSELARQYEQLRAAESTAQRKSTYPLEPFELEYRGRPGVVIDETKWHNMLDEVGIDWTIKLAFARCELAWHRIALTDGSVKVVMLSKKGLSDAEETKVLEKLDKDDPGRDKAPTAQLKITKTTAIGKGSKGHPNPAWIQLDARCRRLCPGKELPSTINVSLSYIVWRYQNNYLPIPDGFEISHLGEAFHNPLYIPGFKLGWKLEILALETRELNESRKLCTKLGLPHMRRSAEATWEFDPNDPLDPYQDSFCIHAMLGYQPCFTPCFLAARRMPSFQSPWRLAVTSGNRGTVAGEGKAITDKPESKTKRRL